MRQSLLVFIAFSFGLIDKVLGFFFLLNGVRL